MAFVDFPSLQKIATDPKSKGEISKDSSLVLCQLMNVVSNLMTSSQNMTEDELAMMTISIQTWLNRRNNIDSKIEFEIGDIVYADLGINYKSELAYGHPVIILENIGNMVLVAPVTTSKEKIQEAYHPIHKPNGNKYYRKVNKNEDNFEESCVILLSDIKPISKGRLIKKHKKLKQNINDPNSLFYEIKIKMFKYFLPKFYIEHLKLGDQIRSKNEEIEKLTTELLETSAKYTKLLKSNKEKEKNSSLKG